MSALLLYCDSFRWLAKSMVLTTVSSTSVLLRGRNVWYMCREGVCCVGCVCAVLYTLYPKNLHSEALLQDDFSVWKALGVLTDELHHAWLNVSGRKMQWPRRNSHMHSAGGMAVALPCHKVLLPISFYCTRNQRSNVAKSTVPSRSRQLDVRDIFWTSCGTGHVPCVRY